MAESAATAASFDQEAHLAPCVEEAEGVWILVNVYGIDGTEGNVRVQVYGDNPDDFLASGKKLARVDVPVRADEMDVCVPLPVQGQYSVVAMHDKNANGKADIFSEGFGFSNNPKFRFGPPDHKKTLINLEEGVSEVAISLKYVAGSEDQNKRDLRKSRRR